MASDSIARSAAPGSSISLSRTECSLVGVVRPSGKEPSLPSPDGAGSRATSTLFRSARRSALRLEVGRERRTCTTRLRRMKPLLYCLSYLAIGAPTHAECLRCTDKHRCLRQLEPSRGYNAAPLLRLLGESEPVRRGDQPRTRLWEDLAPQWGSNPRLHTRCRPTFATVNLSRCH